MTSEEAKEAALAKTRKRNAKYRRTKNGKENAGIRVGKHHRTAKGKAVRTRYRKSAKGMAAKRAYRATLKYKQSTNKRQRKRYQKLREGLIDRRLKSIPTTTKVCSVCKIDKSVHEFYTTARKRPHSTCKLCLRAGCKDYHSRNRAANLVRRNAWYADNKGSIELKRTRQARYQVDNNSRRVRKLKAPGRGVTREDWQRIIWFFDDQCAYCRDRGVKMTMDHVEPLKRGGAHSPDNIVPACLRCNSSKNDRLLLEWAMTDFGSRCAFVEKENICAGTGGVKALAA